MEQHRMRRQAVRRCGSGGGSMSIALGAGLVVGAWAARAEPASPIATALAKPTAKPIRFADWEVGAFFHYDLNPFTGQEHGDGQEPFERFNPSSLDVNQWIQAAKHMGDRYAILTARHGNVVDLIWA